MPCSAPVNALSIEPKAELASLARRFRPAELNETAELAASVTDNDTGSAALGDRSGEDRAAALRAHGVDGERPFGWTDLLDHRLHWITKIYPAAHAKPNSSSASDSTCFAVDNCPKQVNRADEGADTPSQLAISFRAVLP